MPAPRSKPLLAWEPLPFLVLVGLLLLTGWIRPDGPPAAFRRLEVLVLAALHWLG